MIASSSAAKSSWLAYSLANAVPSSSSYAARRTSSFSTRSFSGSCIVLRCPPHLGMPGADSRSNAGRHRQHISFYTNPNSRQLLPVSRRAGGERARCHPQAPRPAAGASNFMIGASS